MGVPNPEAVGVHPVHEREVHVEHRPGVLQHPRHVHVDALRGAHEREGPVLVLKNLGKHVVCPPHALAVAHPHRVVVLGDVVLEDGVLLESEVPGPVPAKLREHCGPANAWEHAEPLILRRNLWNPFEEQLVDRIQRRLDRATLVHEPIADEDVHLAARVYEA